MEINYKKFFGLAQDKCYDWKPEKQWVCKEIEFIWFDRKGLQEFIKNIIESTTENTEK